MFKLSEIIVHGAFSTKPLQNEKKSKLDNIMKQKRTTITLRYEEIEQNNSMVQLVIAVKEITVKGNFYYVISRSRDLGEFVPEYTSETKKYDKAKGIVFE